MTNFEQMIEYQKLDMELRRLNNEFNKNPDKKKLDSARNDFNAAQAVFDKSVAESEDYAKEIEQVYADFTASEKEIAELEKAFSSAATDEEKAALLPRMELAKARLETYRNKVGNKIEAIKRLLGTCAQEQKKKKTVKEEFDRINAKLKDVKDSFMTERNKLKEKMSELEKKIDGIKSALDGAISVKQMPEFRKLDTLIAEYLRTLSYDTIPDLLITANGIKDTANRYIVSGNVLRGETMLSDLRIRLSRVNVWGSSAVAAVTDAVAAHKLPVTYSSEAMASFGEAVKAYEQAPAFPGEDLTAELLRAKKAAFNDTDRESLDRDTFAEMLEIGQEMNGGEADKGRIDNLTELKKELMSFNLSYFIDLSPAIYEEKEPAAPAAPAADTQAILDAISNLQVVQAAPAAAPQQDAKLQGKLEELAKNKPNLSVKKPRQLRPAVSSKDNKVEKTDQPLRVVRRKISLTEEGETLSKQVVDELAQKIANSMVK